MSTPGRVRKNLASLALFAVVMLGIASLCAHVIGFSQLLSIFIGACVAGGVLAWLGAVGFYSKYWRGSSLPR
jgi:ABC-type uncharacterized transport system permease subunit